MNDVDFKRAATAGSSRKYFNKKCPNCKKPVDESMRHRGDIVILCPSCRSLLADVVRKHSEGNT